MYAVIHTGGKQYRVEQGQTLEVERLNLDPEKPVELRPVLVVDGDTVLSKPDQLQGASVTAKIVGEAKGEKIRGFTYKNKSNQRRRWGHRQQYSVDRDHRDLGRLSAIQEHSPCRRRRAPPPPGTGATPTRSGSV